MPKKKPLTPLDNRLPANCQEILDGWPGCGGVGNCPAGSVRQLGGSLHNLVPSLLK